MPCVRPRPHLRVPGAGARRECQGRRPYLDATQPTSDPGGHGEGEPRSARAAAACSQHEVDGRFGAVYIESWYIQLILHKIPRNLHSYIPKRTAQARVLIWLQVWDDELATVAQGHADQCIFRHECIDCRRVSKYNFVQVPFHIYFYIFIRLKSLSYH